MARVGADIRVQSSAWIETQTAFGQVRQETQVGPDYFDGMITVLLEAGGSLPEGSRRLGRYLGISGTVENSKPCCKFRISQIRTGAPAYAAGMQVGDEITRINGKKFKTHTEFLLRFRNVSLGRPFPVSISRNSVEHKAMVLSQEWPVIGSEEFSKAITEFTQKPSQSKQKP